MDHVFCRSKFNNKINYNANIIETCFSDHWETMLYIGYIRKTSTNTTAKLLESSKIDVQIFKSSNT